LGELPQLAAALGRGELSYAKVRALTRIATPETEAPLHCTTPLDKTSSSVFYGLSGSQSRHTL